MRIAPLLLLSLWLLAGCAQTPDYEQDANLTARTPDCMLDANLTAQMPDYVQDYAYTKDGCLIYNGRVIDFRTKEIQLAPGHIAYTKIEDGHAFDTLYYDGKLLAKDVIYFKAIGDQVIYYRSRPEKGGSLHWYVNGKDYGEGTYETAFNEDHFAFFRCVDEAKYELNYCPPQSKLCKPEIHRACKRYKVVYDGVELGYGQDHGFYEDPRGSNGWDIIVDKMLLAGDHFLYAHCTEAKNDPGSALFKCVSYEILADGKKYEEVNASWEIISWEIMDVLKSLASRLYNHSEGELEPRHTVSATHECNSPRCRVSYYDFNLTFDGVALTGEKERVYAYELIGDHLFYIAWVEEGDRGLYVDGKRVPGMEKVTSDFYLVVDGKFYRLDAYDAWV
ncbi:hypothetical protein HYY74_08140 [Candidatus Woesearchaeota archaeon]|nr:hypothetical protein [Candidatus Woesearchaeota archaeon]